MKTLVKTALFLSLIGFLTYIAGLQFEEDNAKVRLGEKIPEFKASYHVEFTPVKNAPTLYVRFESWCPSCVRSIGFNNVLFKKYKDRLNITALAAMKDQGVEELINTRIHYPVQFLEDKALDSFFKLRAIPFYFAVSPSGVVLYQGNFIEEGEIEKIILKARQTT